MFIKITKRQNKPVGGGISYATVLLNMNNILYIEKMLDVYRIKLIGKEDIFIEEEEYKRIESIFHV